MNASEVGATGAAERRYIAAADDRTSGRARIGVLDRMREDLETILARDPSVHSLSEAIFHSTLPAVWIHRVAHRLYRGGHRVPARILTNIARMLTGVEMHPGATIGRRLFIDHGTGVIIGETAVIGADVTIYQQVTLGAVGWWRDKNRPKGERRHPLVGDRVTFGASAQVLGPITVGDGCMIGAMSLVVTDIEAGSKVLAAVAGISKAEKRRMTQLKAEA